MPVAAALVSAKLLVRVAHVEAGLRSFDRSMPEELNRLVTDQLSDFYSRHRMMGMQILSARAFPPQYALLTLHRPANVDDPDMLQNILKSLLSVSMDLPIIFPVHQRTRQKISEFGLHIKRIRLCDPVSYLEFPALQQQATVVLTDSRGIQEETTYLGIPCLTLRPNTERPITITMGTNTLIGNDTAKLRREIENVLNGHAKKGVVPPLWNGHAGERIASSLEKNV